MRYPASSRPFTDATERSCRGPSPEGWARIHRRHGAVRDRAPFPRLARRASVQLSILPPRSMRVTSTANAVTPPSPPLPTIMRTGGREALPPFTATWSCVTSQRSRASPSRMTRSTAPPASEGQHRDTVLVGHADRGHRSTRTRTRGRGHQLDAFDRPARRRIAHGEHVGARARRNRRAGAEDRGCRDGEENEAREVSHGREVYGGVARTREGKRSGRCRVGRRSGIGTIGRGYCVPHSLGGQTTPDAGPAARTGAHRINRRTSRQSSWTSRLVP